MWWWTAATLHYIYSLISTKITEHIFPLASDTKTYFFVLDKRDLVNLIPCPGCTCQLIKYKHLLKRPQIEQQCPGADYWWSINYICDSERGRCFLPIPLPKRIQLQHPSFRCILMFWYPYTSGKWEVIIPQCTMVQNMLLGYSDHWWCTLLKYHRRVCHS